MKYVPVAPGAHARRIQVVKTAAFIVSGIFVCATQGRASDRTGVICYENRALETGGGMVDGNMLVIRLDLDKKAAAAHTESAWGGQDLGTISIVIEKKEGPIQRTITSIGADGRATDALKLKINGFLTELGDTKKISEGAPGESILKVTDHDGKAEYVTSLLNCFGI